MVRYFGRKFENATKPPKTMPYRNAISQVTGSLSAPTTFGTSFSRFGSHAGDSRMKNHTRAAMATRAPAMTRCVGR